MSRITTMNENVSYYVYKVWVAFGMVLGGCLRLDIDSNLVSVDKLLALLLALR